MHATAASASSLRQVGLVLLPDALDLAMEILLLLPQLFTTSQARQTLNTSRRVAIPLLGRSDRLGRTRMLTDSRREALR